MKTRALGLVVEALEAREVPAVGMVGNDLVIVGTAGPDAVSVNAYNAGAVSGVFNGVAFGPFAVPGRVIIDTGDGPDVLNLSGYVPMEVHAGAGNDSVFGGSGDDILYLGAGNDYATAGIGDDVVIGGEGRDTLQGGNGLDVLTGNVVDEVVWDYAALRAAQQEWSASAASPLVTALFFAQVDDGWNDQLSGGLGRDAFLTLAGDVITDFKVAEGDKKVFP